MLFFEIFSNFGTAITSAVRSLTWIDYLGYIGACITIATYSMKTMIPLRIVGMCANVFFLAYGFMAKV
jgi:CRP/FNR family transcriptional regulator, cyclic AMP receptor protein